MGGDLRRRDLDACEREFGALTKREDDDMPTILIVIVLILLLGGGGGGYYAHSYYGGAGLGGVLGLVLIVCAALWLLGR
jgi:hypothetical protein